MGRSVNESDPEDTVVTPEVRGNYLEQCHTENENQTLVDVGN